MSTQGICSITKRGETVFKIVAGCNGFNAPALAQSLRDNPTESRPEILARCRQVEFGCDRCLIIQGSPIDFYHSEFLDMGDWEDTRLYRDKFSDPAFNPRWENGTAAYTEIVEQPTNHPPKK